MALAAMDKDLCVCLVCLSDRYKHTSQKANMRHRGGTQCSCKCTPYRTPGVSWHWGRKCLCLPRTPAACLPSSCLVLGSLCPTHGHLGLKTEPMWGKRRWWPAAGGWERGSRGRGLGLEEGRFLLQSWLWVQGSDIRKQNTELTPGEPEREGGVGVSRRGGVGDWLVKHLLSALAKTPKPQKHGSK